MDDRAGMTGETPIGKTMAASGERMAACVARAMQKSEATFSHGRVDYKHHLR